MRIIRLLKCTLLVNFLLINALQADMSEEDKIKVLSDYLINREQKDPVAARNEAMATIYGKPQFKNLVYDDASEMFFAEIVSQKGDFIRDVNFYMPRQRAIAFKKDLKSGKINVEHAFDDGEIVIKGVELNYKGVNYPLHVKDSTSMKLKIGAYSLINQDTQFLAIKNGIGGVVNLQDALGMEDKTQVFRLSGLYKFNDKHQVELSYYAITNSNKAINEKEFEYNGAVIKANATLDIHFNTDIYKVAYIYSAYQTNKLDLSFRIGLHTTTISTGIDVVIAIDEGEQETTQADRIAITAPLPTIGIALDYEIIPNVKINYTIDYFFVSYENISGYMTDTLLSLEYDYNKYLGAGIGFNSTNMLLKGKTKKTEYEVRNDVSGILAYLTFSY